MERTKWTDDMLDQRFASMDEKFDLLFSELRLLRQEMRAEFAAVREEMRAMREEMRAGFAATREEMASTRTDLRAEMAAVRVETLAFHRQVLYVVVTLWVGLLGLFATQL